MSNELQKPVIGFTCGDLNGIGLELIIKTFIDQRILDFCIPIVFASNKSMNFYRKGIPDANFNCTNINNFSRINPKQVNIFNVWEEELGITPGELNEIGGQYALKSLEEATKALKEGHIHGLVTAPIHKKNHQSESIEYIGHTPYYKAV